MTIRMTIAFLALLPAVLTDAAETHAYGNADEAGKDANLPVFILAGQSNMDGAGVVEELPVELKGPQTNVLFAQFWSTEFKPLDPMKLGKSFGPEVTFGSEMARGLNRPVGIIKMSAGGTSLERHWNPVTIDREDRYVGANYRGLIGYVKSVQARHKNIRIAGMIWMQGEADAQFHSKTVEQYRDKLEALIDGCRKEFGVPDLPFVCGRISCGGQYRKQVREAQETVKRENYVWIDCDDLEKHPDKLHYSSRGQLELGRRFAAAMLKLIEDNRKKAGAPEDRPQGGVDAEKRGEAR